MEQKIYPKVLIIGETFDKTSGGGITLSNLFFNWPKDKIAVASNANLSDNVDNSVCETYYQLGYNDKLHPFPLNILLPKIKCGLIYSKKSEINTAPNTDVPKGKFKHIYKFLYATLNFLGIYNFIYKLKITPDFKAWIDEYNPDIIYSQLSTLEMIRFIDDVHEYTKKPIAIHIMDDWPSTISKIGPLYFYWKHVIDKEFRTLLDKSSILMSICQSMSDEYLERYNHNFEPFHNPINIDYWLPFSKNNWDKKEEFRILYAGRVGHGIKKSIAKVSEVVMFLNQTGYNITFEIQTQDNESINEIFSNHGTKWIKPLKYSDLPKRFSEADILLLPEDFDKKSVSFLKFSMPTKASEYMISGTPILVFADKRTAIAQYASKENWAYVVTENTNSVLSNAITDLYLKDELRKNIGERAKEVAMQNENAEIVRDNFRKTFLIN